MASMNQLWCVLSFLLCLVTCSKADQQWCIASPGATDPQLDGFLKFVCSQLDCSAINPGGQCFQPNTYRNHGSYALDLYYRAKGECNTDIGMPSVVDPSFGNCHYP